MLSPLSAHRHSFWRSCNIPRTVTGSKSLSNPVLCQSYKVQISKTNPMNTSHEQSMQNPVIQVETNKVIQHPSINAAYCEKPGCKSKLCELNNADCGVITKAEAIGHGTHADSSKIKDSEYLSNTDFNGKPRPQYARIYSVYKRVPLSNHEQTYNETATKEVNNNKEMLNNINMHKRLKDD